MYEMNKDLPYEQQVKILLHHYDQLVVENKALKARIKEMESENHCPDGSAGLAAVASEHLG